jgi:hypothetical protein
VFLTDEDSAADEIIGRMPRAAIGGTPKRIADIVGHYADAGLDELIVPDFTFGPLGQKLELMDHLATEVFPQFR